MCAGCGTDPAFRSCVHPPHPSLGPLSTWPGLSASQGAGPPHPATEEPPSFRVLQTSSFANYSWAYTQGGGWLGELQTHGWDNVRDTIRFLWPWSRGNFSAVELKNLQSLFALYFHGFAIEVQAFARYFQFECEFIVPRRCLPGSSSPLPKGLGLQPVFLTCPLPPFGSCSLLLHVSPHPHPSHPPSTYTEGPASTHLFIPLYASSCSGSLQWLSPCDLLTPRTPDMAFPSQDPAVPSPTSPSLYLTIPK